VGSSRPNTIELNGNLYDASTGRLLATSAPKANPVSMDGVVKRTPKTRGTHTRVAAKGVHAKTHRSKTLNRKIVKKPSFSAAKQAVQNAVIQGKQELHTLDAQREKRAHQIKKSKLVQRFGFSDVSITPRFAALPVKKAPATAAKPATKAKTHTAPPTNPVLAAIQNATSHEQPKPKKTPAHHKVARKLRISPKTLNVATTACAVLLIGSFIAYQNVPNLAVKIAASRAGVQASMPSYQPSGFALLGNVQYKPGQVALTYKSRTDDRNYNIIQTASSWNSDALLENFINTARRTYQTYQDKGKTIYVYDGSNATWVDGGVWYQIEGNSSLNSDQLLRLAGSL
jgi:Domain of unknown function (DUF4367)